MIDLTDPATKLIQLHIPLDPVFHDRLRRAAAACDQSPSQFVWTARATTERR